MKDICVEIGTIQAFLDGELSLEENARVTDHIGGCDNCALMLAEAEEEIAIVFPALEREMNTLVPTQRLWSKINDSIQLEKESTPIWEKAYAFLRVALGNPSMVAAASLLLVFGTFAALWLNKSIETVDYTTPNVARTQPSAAPVVTTTAPKQVVETPEPEVVKSPEEDTVPRIERAVYRPVERRPASTSPVTREAAPAAAYLAGEESYVKTIATLARSADEQKSGVMRPSELVAYERDMALVNDTIAKMRKEVRRNPNNDTAKQILYSSYQNKIDLLNSVAQKEELVASLK